MSKEQTIEEGLKEVLEVIDGNGVPNMIWVRNKLHELLIKEKEQREGEIKKAFTDGANWELYGDDKTQEERAEQYYNEVFKTTLNNKKHLNK